MNKPLLSCKNISLKLSGVPVIENINLCLYPGEFHLLMGENGAGKTSIVNILSGIYPCSAYKGSLTYKGQPLQLHTPKDALKRHIVTIHQEICLFEDMTIAENLFANLPAKTALKSFTSLDKKIRLANAFFEEHLCAIDSSRLILQCSPATKRKIELLKLYLMEPELLILDEPVAIFNDYDMEYFLRLITDFQKKGTTILCISHNYHAFFNRIDRFSIFYEKELRTTMNRKGFQSEDIENILLSDFCQSRYPKINIEKGKEVLCAENISNNGSIKDISFSLHKGEILGFFGRAGSGKNTLPKALFGMEPLQKGKIYIDRLPARILSPQDAIGLGLAYITDERNDCGLFENLDLLENVYSIKGNNFQHFWTRTSFEYKRYYKYARKLNIDFSPKSIPDHLSGGEQQKLILMRWLMSPARIFIFNEPTQSIDIPSKIDIYNMFNDLVLKGASILIFSSNLEELLGVCDRVIFIKEGIISGEVSRDESPEYIHTFI
ncbi:MAG: sugar ABC transporter ATP-binding protein [Eubacteriales bacterium]|nr:sugar ABC transporter ATP-binding protein [Eubacteriales bacterium]